LLLDCDCDLIVFERMVRNVEARTSGPLYSFSGGIEHAQMK
jgi:hypothetical protein